MHNEAEKLPTGESVYLLVESREGAVPPSPLVSANQERGA